MSRSIASLPSRRSRPSTCSACGSSGWEITTIIAASSPLRILGVEVLIEQGQHLVVLLLQRIALRFGLVQRVRDLLELFVELADRAEGFVAAGSRSLMRR